MNGSQVLADRRGRVGRSSRGRPRWGGLRTPSPRRNHSARTGRGPRRRHGHRSTASGPACGAVSHRAAETRSSSARASTTGFQVTSSGRPASSSCSQITLGTSVSMANSNPPWRIGASSRWRPSVTCASQSRGAPATAAPPTPPPQAEHSNIHAQSVATGTRRPTTQSPSAARAAEPMLSTVRRSPVARFSHTTIRELREISRNPAIGDRPNPGSDPHPTPDRPGPTEGRLPARRIVEADCRKIQSPSMTFAWRQHGRPRQRALATASSDSHPEGPRHPLIRRTTRLLQRLGQDPPRTDPRRKHRSQLASWTNLVRRSRRQNSSVRAERPLIAEPLTRPGRHHGVRQHRANHESRRTALAPRGPDGLGPDPDD